MTKEQFMRKYPEGTEFEVLGTTYTLYYDDSITADHDANGLAELYSKKIIVSLHGYNDDEAFESIEDYYKKVLRHELMHAFFHEMGLDNYCRDEILVDSLALQLPKIKTLMKGFM